MKLEKNIYPYDPDAKTLPFFLSGIGGSLYQESISRPNGYHWDQILFCASGSGILEYEDISVRISEGDYFFLPKNQPHFYHADKEYWNVQWTAFEGSCCEDVLRRFGMTRPVVISAPKEHTMEKIFGRMIYSQENDVLYCNHTCSGLIYEYILEFHRLMDKNNNSRKSRQIALIIPTLRYMQENFRKDISMTELSEMINVTPQYFCRIFGSTMNMRPNEYLTRIRIDEARQLLSNEKISVSQAGELSGFRDASYFSTVFRKHVGVSPCEYRKNEKK